MEAKAILCMHTLLSHSAAGPCRDSESPSGSVCDFLFHSAVNGNFDKRPHSTFNILFWTKSHADF